MNDELLKKRIAANLANTTLAFMEREDIVSRFGVPQIGYVDAEDMRFDMLFARDLNDHPKKIYRPGKSIIVYYIPYGEEIARANEACDSVSPEWSRAHTESLWLAMILNRTIIKDLDSVGRLHSHLNTMLEWSDKKMRGDWNHKFAAAMAGLGRIGYNGSFIPNEVPEGFARYGGRCGGVITDGLYAERKPAMDAGELERRYDRLMWACGYGGGETSEKSIEEASSNPLSKASTKTALCPCGAVSEKGVDRDACKRFCKTLNTTIPEPDVCGKCFSY